MSDSRIVALDGVRGIAIVLVLWSHAYAALPMTPWTALPIAVGRVGWMGVDLFFVLSGFLITQRLLATRDTPKWLAAFFARRVLRIWPLYLAVLLILTTLAHAWPELAPADARQFRETQGWYWTHTVNVLFALRGRLGADAYATSHFWSLGIEEQFYLVWPFALAAIAPRRLARMCLVIALASVALRAIGLASGVAPMATYTLPITRLDGLAMGAWLAVAGDAPRVRVVIDHLARLAPLRWIILGAGIIAYLSALEAGQFTARMQIVGFPVVVLGALALVAVASRGEATMVARPLASKALVWLGQRSYGLYVLHLPTYYAIRFIAEAHGWSVGLRLCVSIGASVALAAVSWWAWESRWLALKRFVPTPNARVASSAVLTA